MRKYYQHSIKNTINVHKIITVDFFERDGGFSSFLEQHNFWEFAFLKKGEITFELPNSENVSLSSGEFFFLPPNQKHKIIVNEKSSMFILCFKCVTPILNSLSFLKNKLNKDGVFYVSSIMEEALNTFDVNNYDKLTPLDSARLGGEQCIQSLLTIFILNLLREQTETFNPKLFIKKDDEIDAICASVLTVLQNNIYSNLSISDICYQLNYSRSYLSHLFKQKYGKSIMTYFNELKIERAKGLLQNDKLSVKQIAEKLHFSDVSYFNFVFKKQVGLTPSGYKNSIIRK